MADDFCENEKRRTINRPPFLNQVRPENGRRELTLDLASGLSLGSLAFASGLAFASSLSLGGLALASVLTLASGLSLGSLALASVLTLASRLGFATRGLGGGHFFALVAATVAELAAKAAEALTQVEVATDVADLALEFAAESRSFDAAGNCNHKNSAKHNPQASKTDVGTNQLLRAASPNTALGLVQVEWPHPTQWGEPR